MPDVGTQVISEFELENELYTVSKLDAWLTYEGYSPLLLGGGFFLPVGLVVVVATIAAIVFIPLAAKWLFELRRFGWMVAEAIPICIGIIAYLIPEKQALTIAFMAFLPAFYIWTWTFKLAVIQWRESLRYRLEVERARTVNDLDF